MDQSFKSRLQERTTGRFTNTKGIPIPKDLKIETNTSCNHSCIFCLNRKADHTKVIDFDLAKRIIREAREMGVENISFHRNGEPLLYKRLSELVRYSKELGYRYVYLTTNGYFLTREKSIELIEAGVDSFKFSINASTREKYKFIHGQDHFDIVCNNLKDLHCYIMDNSLKVGVYVTCVTTQYTEETVQELKKVFPEISDNIVGTLVRDLGGIVPEVSEYLIPKQNGQLYTYGHGLLPCPLFYNYITVSCDGYLTACCNDCNNYLAVADLNKKSLLDAWNSSLMEEWKKCQLEGNVKNTLCDICLNGYTTMPDPLDQNLYTPFTSDIFTDFKVMENRVKQYFNK